MNNIKHIIASRTTRIVVGIVFSIISLYLALVNVNYTHVAMSFHRAHWLFVWLAVISITLHMVAKAIRWKVLLGARSATISFWRIVAALYVGHTLNVVLLARLGEISRAHTIGSLGAGRSFVLGGLVLEKVLDMVAFMLLFLVVIILMPLPHWLSTSAYSMIGITIIVILITTGVMYQRTLVARGVAIMLQWLPVHIRVAIEQRIAAGLSSLDVLQQRSDRLWLATWTIVIWGTSILNNYLALLALDIHIPTPFVAAVIVLIIVQIGISLPSAPVKIGVFQYACILALSLFGINESTAFSYGVLLNIIIMVPTIIPGVLFVWLLGKQSHNVSAPVS